MTSPTSKLLLLPAADNDAVTLFLMRPPPVMAMPPLAAPPLFRCVFLRVSSSVL
jgi:hypothetical protein